MQDLIWLAGLGTLFAVTHGLLSAYHQHFAKGSARR